MKKRIRDLETAVHKKNTKNSTFKLILLEGDRYRTNNHESLIKDENGNFLYEDGSVYHSSDDECFVLIIKKDVD